MNQPAPQDGYSQQLLEGALQQCANEAIHLIGAIQPAGVLLAVDRQQLRLVACSDNLGLLFAMNARQAMGYPLEKLVGRSQALWLDAMLQQDTWVGAKTWVLDLQVNGRMERHDAQIMLSGALVLIEVEQQQSPTGDVFQDLFVPIRDSLWKLDAEAELDRYAQMAVEQVRLLTGFDRVMMYRFDSNWDGEVIAECKTGAADSYLGNRFPASDIPPQARELYTRNLVRLVADVDSVPVALVQSGAHAAPIDLSHSWLRCLSPLHVEYLRNMGVKASLSISLVQNGQLWGLIACHHFSPRYVSLRKRELNEFIGRMVSLRLIHMDTLERDDLGRRICVLLTELTERIRSTPDLDAVILPLQQQLLGLVRAQGAVVVIDGRHHHLGETPPTQVVERLAAVLRERPVAPMFCTEDLCELVHDSPVPDPAAPGDARGLLLAPLDHRLRDYVMWFRPGLLRTLKWAGNPQKTLVADDNGVRISPRTSFRTWIQTYQAKSMPWSRVEVDAAHFLSMALIEVLAQRALKKSEESYRLLAENSTDMIARLDLEGRFLFASPACQELFECDGRPITDLRLADVLEEPEPDIAKLLRGLQVRGATLTRSLRGRRQDGAPLWIEATLRHTLDSHGQDEILLNARDITQRYTYQMAIEDVHRRNNPMLEPDGAVQNGAAEFSDSAAEARLFHRATHDALTDLPNRMHFTDSLGRMLERCKRTASAVAVLCIDLDRRKIINDALDHTVGDAYLKTISERLAAASRRPDPLARWGGETFVMAMEGVDNHLHIAEVVARMRAALAEPIHIAGHELIPTASIGIALYPADASRPAALIKAADTAMHGAREQGGNGYLFYSGDRRTTRAPN